MILPKVPPTVEEISSPSKVFNQKPLIESVWSKVFNQKHSIESVRVWSKAFEFYQKCSSLIKSVLVLSKVFGFDQKRLRLIKSVCLINIGCPHNWQFLPMCLLSQITHSITNPRSIIQLLKCGLNEKMTLLFETYYDFLKSNYPNCKCNLDQCNPLVSFFKHKQEKKSLWDLGYCFVFWRCVELLVIFQHRINNTWWGGVSGQITKKTS